ncbi:MAG: hypothetical protein H6815_05420 [Phycisphaeraceae bacterium]|nr:hypothetical protein [Phycisphaerales bacterium]MCB9859877.1 hypothetical protein [Phycisphaeraceae bacterium]
MIIRASIVSAAVLCVCAGATAQTVVVPNAAANAAGTGGYTTIFNNQPRGYQLIIGQAELGGMPVGSVVTGLEWRQTSWQVYPSWPSVTLLYSQFDVSLATAANTPANMSTTYTENIGPDVVQVHSGAWQVDANSYAGGSLSPTPNAWGTTIQFASPFTYQGGDLCLTILHTGHGFSNCALDTVGSADMKAKGTSDISNPNDWYNQGPIVTRFLFDAPVACYADCDNNNTLNIFDYICFGNAYSTNDPYADCDGSGGLNVFDYICFGNAYAAGCP